MRHVVTLSAVLLLAVLISATAAAADDQGQPCPLFDGESLAGWDYFLVEPDVKMEDVWSVRDGLLICKGKPNGYLATKKDFTNFKLVVEWRWAPGEKPGNSGVLMRITGEKMMLPNCVEAQLAHNKAGDMYGFQGFKVDGDPARKIDVPDHKLGGHLTGLTKIAGAEKPAGEWNKYEITANGDKITLIVNGKKVNEATGCDVRAGKIALQSEGGEIHFRTICVVPLADSPDDVQLFNGKDLSGWAFRSPNADAKMEDTFSVRDGVLRCTGKPVGYLYTQQKFANYRMKLQWRWLPDSKPGNNGVLLRILEGEHFHNNVWPKCVEAQLANGRAGDIFTIGQFPLKGDPARTKGRYTAMARPSNEKPIGEWNQYEIILQGGDLTLKVNGLVQNVATELYQAAGPIGLQSEGAAIEYRDIRLVSLD